MAKIENYEIEQVEKEILDFWEKNKVYENIKKRNSDKKPFYYLDGPPYTSGKIHIGHAWGKALRDAAMRYKRAQGFDVWDRSGFDMHGLPISHKVQAKFDIKNKDSIPEFGVEKFVDECKKLAIENMNSMITDFERLGIWMDFKNPYKPIDNSYIEGIWWLIKKAHENKRLYEGFRTLTWCASCETATAKHELEYENVVDKSIFVKFKIEDKENEYLIIWTTTPWTIPFNLAVMVNPNLDYMKVKVDNEIWVVAKALANVFISNVVGKEFEIIEEFKGEELEGVKYIHPFNDIIDYPKSEKLHSVLLSAEHVDTSAGTGLVHCAPGCGPEDYEVGHRNGLPAFNLLTEQGIFEGIKGFDGLQAKVDDKKFIEALDKVGALIASTDVEHDYPHCWRCHKPVIFRATKQWFFKVEDIKEEMREENKKIDWVPEWAGNKQFDSWLKNLRDNSITKQMYWGTPFPVWKCESCEEYKVIGSVKEIEELGEKAPKDLHRPYIDNVTLPCTCGSKMTRHPDVLDVWVDSGCASWLSLDYPVRTDLFEKLFPADFILEGKDQIRGWFNLLMVASMISMKKPSFKSVYMHGFINDSQGRKMSKSLGNVISPYEIIDKYGSDTLRTYVIGAANAGLDMNYNFDDLNIKNKNIGILWNLHNYLMDSANLAGINPSKIKNPKLSIEEKYMLSKLNSSIKHLTKIMDEYRLNEAPAIVENIFLELSRTYIQLVREKLTSGSDEEKESVFYTIYQVLIETIKIFTPFAPFVSEKIYQNFKEEFGLKENSISDYAWPIFSEDDINIELENDFIIAKDVIGAILNGREKATLGVRWPIKEVVVTTQKDEVKKAVENLKHLIMVQTNIKKIIIEKEFKGIEKIVKPDYKALGPDFGPLAPKIIARLATESPQTILKHTDKDGYKMNIDGADVVIKKNHLVVENKVSDGYTYSEFSNGEVFVDTIRTKELDAEGYYREISRRMQNLRKNSGLHKSDNIRACIELDEDLKESIKQFENDLKDKIGANSIDMICTKPTHDFDAHNTETIKGKIIKLYFSKL